MEICSSSTRSMYVTTCPRHEFQIYCETQRTINTTTTSVFVIKQFIRHRKTKLQTAIIKPGLNTLGDNLQQHVAVTCHSDKMFCVYWQNVCENLCLCNGNLWKNKLQKSSDLLLQIVAHFLTSPAHKE